MIRWVIFGGILYFLAVAPPSGLLAQRTFVLADLDIAEICLKLFLVDGRPHLCRLVETVANF